MCNIQILMMAKAQGGALKREIIRVGSFASPAGNGRALQLFGGCHEIRQRYGSNMRSLIKNITLIFRFWVCVCVFYICLSVT